MSVFFTRRGAPYSTEVSLAIGGTGNQYSCLVSIEDTKYYNPTSEAIIVNYGDTIKFIVGGRSSSLAGTITINGEVVLTNTIATPSSYEWTVPKGISAILVLLDYSSNYGRITVTTS